MEASRPRPVQVMLPPSQYIQSSQTMRSSVENGNFRSLSVNEALQYTPLTTSVLPAHDRILIPQICRARESARLTSSSERKAVQQSLVQHPVAQVKERLQGLLRSDGLPQYKFRLPLQKKSDVPSEVKHKEQPEYTLSPLAKMVFEMSSIEYTRTSVHRQNDNSHSTPTSSFPHGTETLQPISHPELAPKITMPPKSKVPPKMPPTNDRLLAGPEGQMPLISKPVPRPISINIPKPIPEQSPKIDMIRPESSKPVTAMQNEQSVSLSLHGRSQRDAADAALQQFQNTLLEVFEAQDQLDAGSTAVYEAGFFEYTNDDGDDSEPTLSVKTMEKLLLGMKKLVVMNKLSDLSSEHLRRLQRLCEPSMDRAQTANLRIPSDADTDEQRNWRRSVQKADVGLLSASLFLHSILGPTPHESLLTTEALIWVPNILRNTFESCLIPAVESRPDDGSSDIFKTAITHRDDVRRLLESSRKILDIVSTACTQTRGLESVVNPTEFLAARLIFVQNASTDKHSAVGMQTFEKVRKTAMSSLARIFARFPAERSAILDEVLTSLDKLPSNSRNARQYKLGDGKNIQLISALFMQLVQNTAIEIPLSRSKTKRKSASKRLGDLVVAEDDAGDDDGAEDSQSDAEVDEDEEGDAFAKLRAKGNKLFDVAARSAQEIVFYLVGRASKATKTGDSPYRNILDLFIEDLVVVLSLPEWPSSELMLSIMGSRMIEMAQNEKTAAAKNMALECLGTMGSAISTLKASLSRKNAAMFREGKPKSAIAEHLAKLATDYEQGVIVNDDLIAFNGPFSIVSRHLWTEADHGLRTLSACGYFLAQYAKFMSLIVDATTFDESDIEAEPVRVANFLLDSIAQVGAGSTAIQTFDVVSSEEAELAYTLSVLNMGFSRRFGVIVKTLSSSFSSDSAQVRSRSLKSVVTMLETDSTLLDRDPTIADDVFKCASDDSAMVRDSALSLIARFIIARPGLEQKGIQRLLECASDAKVGVQKRAIGHLKEIYIKDHRQLLKATISRVILKRTVDHEDSVAELAKKTLIEIWITPTLSQLLQSADLAKTKVAIEELTSDVVSCISYDSTLLCPLLKKFLKTILSNDIKATSKSRDLCEKMVEVLFEKTITNPDDRGPLMVLTSFAEADPQLIPPSNLGKLQPYLGNLKSENDLFVFKAVISIFGCVLPHLSATHKPLLLDTQSALMKVISFLGRRAELDTVMSCLSVIDGVLQNTMRLIKLAGSIVLKIKSATATSAASQDCTPQFMKLLRIAGALARYVDLENHWQYFAVEVKASKGNSVAEYMANTLLPLTQPTQPYKTRLLALESLGSLCQAHPAQLNDRQIQMAFFSIFKQGSDSPSTPEEAGLQGVVLKVLDELYAQRAQNKEEDIDDDNQEKQELGKLGGNSRTRDGDSAISMITGRVAKSALSVALSTPGENALIATRTLASISHQGLNHPKFSLLAFVALSSCPDDRIASVAHEAHRLLHQQHESVCEREYISAIHEAFEYQHKVLEDSCGARQPNYKSKLASCFEIVNTSGSKYVKKFVSGLVSRVSAKLSSEDGVVLMDQVLWTLFAIQNLACFDFQKVDEVLHTVLQLELAYSKKGVEISQLLEAALAKQVVTEPVNESMVNTELDTAGETDQTMAINDFATVKRLAPLAATLTIMMEGRSYLKRQYGVGRDVRTAISNNKQAKDTAKAPTKVHGITGEKFWTKSNAAVAQLQDDWGAMLCCQNFVTLMSMDDEINVEEDNGMSEAVDTLAPADIPLFARGTTPSGVKRKLSASATSTPAKRGPGRSRKEARRSTSVSSVDGPDADFAG